MNRTLCVHATKKKKKLTGTTPNPFYQNTLPRTDMFAVAAEVATYHVLVSQKFPLQPYRTHAYIQTNARTMTRSFCSTNKPHSYTA